MLVEDFDDFIVVRSMYYLLPQYGPRLHSELATE
jgi:hypothetical protein